MSLHGIHEVQSLWGQGEIPRTPLRKECSKSCTCDCRHDSARPSHRSHSLTNSRGIPRSERNRSGWYRRRIEDSVYQIATELFSSKNRARIARRSPSPPLWPLLSSSREEKKRSFDAKAAPVQLCNLSSSEAMTPFFCESLTNPVTRLPLTGAISSLLLRR